MPSTFILPSSRVRQSDRTYVNPFAVPSRHLSSRSASSTIRVARRMEGSSLSSSTTAALSRPPVSPRRNASSGVHARRFHPGRNGLGPSSANGRHRPSHQPLHPSNRRVKGVLFTHPLLLELKLFTTPLIPHTPPSKITRIHTSPPRAGSLKSFSTKVSVKGRIGPDGERVLISW